MSDLSLTSPTDTSAQTDPIKTGNSLHVAWTQALLLTLVTVVVHLPALRCEFIWDDDYYVTENDTLRDMDGLVRIWTQPGAVPQYYPLVHSVFWVQYQLFKLNPVSYHAVNLFCHLLVSLLWWRVLKRLSIPGSFLAAMIFAVHPIQVESVVWVTELKNVLSGVFYLLTALAYLRFTGINESTQPQNQSPLRWRWYVIALLCFTAALLSKTVVCTLPAAMVLVMWWKRRTFPWRDLACLLPLFALGLAMGLHTAAMEKNHVGAEGADWAFCLADRLLIAGRVLWFYASQLVLPMKMVFFYDYWQIDPNQYWQWFFPVGVLLVIYALLRNRQLLTGKPLVGILFFAGTLFPALGFINVFPMRYSFVADHFQYLAGMGIIAVVAGLLWHGLRNFPKVRLTASMLIIVLLSLRTTTYIPAYTNQQTLWQHVIANNNAPWMALNNLGALYRDAGEHDKAMICFKQGIIHRPNEYSIYNNLGLTYRDLQQYDRAARVLEYALPLETRDVTLYATLARVRELQGHPLEAIRLLKIATSKRPARIDLWLNMGILQIQQRQWQDAETAIQYVLKHDPYQPKAWLAMGQILQVSSSPKEVADHFTKALTYLPNDASLHNQAALARFKINEPDTAIKHLQVAVQLNPDTVEYLANLGSIYLKQKQWTQAKRWLKRASVIDPNRPVVLRNLAMCLLNDPASTSDDLQLAKASLLHLKQIDPQLSIADQKLLATACEATGDYAGAIQILQPLLKVLTTSPTPPQSEIDSIRRQLNRCNQALSKM